MNAATKNILRACLNVYEKQKDKQALFNWVVDEHKKLSTEPLIIARGTATQNYYQAYSIFLRIIKPMEKENINHSERAHALLSASGASRWMACTPSARLEEQFENKSSSYAEEGTLAHELAERILTFRIAGEPNSKIGDYLGELDVNKEMLAYVSIHTDYVMQQFTEAKKNSPDAVILIEQKVNTSHLIENGSGTCDVIIISEGVLEVIDLKYGAGVKVEAENNPQLMLYGSGALEDFDIVYDIHTVRLTITQPRMDSISSWEISADDLRKWGEEVVKPKALLAYAGEGEQVPGKHCQFCKAAARCKANSDLALSVLKDDFNDPKLLSDEELTEMYQKAPVIEKWLKVVSEYMFSEAMNGKSWPDLKLVDGQNRRGWSNEEEAIRILSIDWEKEHFTTTKLKGIGDIEKLVGKKQFPELLGEVVAYKRTAPSLVHISDKRPAMDPTEQLKADFADDL